MKILIACKRGNVAARDKWGHCLCVDCKSFNKAHRKANPRTEYQAIWAAANKKKSSIYTKKWNEANKVKRSEIVSAWRSANPDKVAAMNAKAGKKWASANKANGAARVAARRVAKLLRTPSWANMQEIAKVYVECARITSDTKIRHEVDHIYPLQGREVSGLHVHQNLQILTRSTNRSKGIKVCAD